MTHSIEAEFACSPPSSERRRERRFPVVGVGLLYSPAEDKCLDEVGRLFGGAVAPDVSRSGLSFDVEQPLAPGEELLIEFATCGGRAERLLAEVRWCQQTEDGHYRIGTRIRKPVAIRTDVAAMPIGKGPPLPSGFSLRCPSCADYSAFTLIGLQSGAWKRGVMALYRCGACASARSMTSILAYNLIPD